MATWAELSSEQQDVYQSFERSLRGAMASFHQVLNTFVELDNAYNAQITSILVDLDDNTVVPNSSGLSGAASLDSDSEMAALVSHMQSAVTTYNTTGHRNLRNKAAGINAALE